jgi:putative transposase
MGLARASYYHKPSKEEKQQTRDMELRQWIEDIHVELPGYGYRRIRRHLLDRGIRVNSKRIKRVMKTYSLFSCIKKLMRPRGKAAGVRLFFPNLIRGRKINGPNQVWATDLTYIKLVTEYVYVSAIIDVYTRKIVGWAISRDLSHKFCLEALQTACRRYLPPAGVIHHSDRGVQYACIDYVEYLNKNNFQISQSRIATPEDNAFKASCSFGSTNASGCEIRPANLQQLSWYLECRTQKNDQYCLSDIEQGINVLGVGFVPKSKDPESATVQASAAILATTTVRETLKVALAEVSFSPKGRSIDQFIKAVSSQNDSVRATAWRELSMYLEKSGKRELFSRSFFDKIQTCAQCKIPSSLASRLEQTIRVPLSRIEAIATRWRSSIPPEITAKNHIKGAGAIGMLVTIGLWAWETDRQAKLVCESVNQLIPMKGRTGEAAGTNTCRMNFDYLDELTKNKERVFPPSRIPEQIRAFLSLSETDQAQLLDTKAGSFYGVCSYFEKAYLHAFQGSPICADKTGEKPRGDALR